MVEDKEISTALPSFKVQDSEEGDLRKDKEKGDCDARQVGVRGMIDEEMDRYPFCVVWTPLPLISWLIPIIGHTGLCSSDGIIHDFSGSYCVSIDDMAFGRPYKYVPLNPDQKEQENWDDALSKADKRFNKETHNICCNNCHSHVAHALNLLRYQDKTDYNMIHIWWMCITKSKYISYMSVVKTYLGFLIIVALVICFYKLLN